MSSSSAMPLTLFIYAFGFYILYWVVRLAVRHALNDARAREAAAAKWAADNDGESPG